jgi:hypothetical protein
MQLLPKQRTMMMTMMVTTTMKRRRIWMKMATMRYKSCRELRNRLDSRICLLHHHISSTKPEDSKALVL